MDDRLRRQLEEIVNQAEVEERDATFLRQALTIDPQVEDGPWLKSMFQLAAIFLELFYGSKEEANQSLPWLLFSWAWPTRGTTKRGNFPKIPSPPKV